MSTWRTTILTIVAVAAVAAGAVAQEAPEKPSFDEKVEAGQWAAETTIGLNLIQSYYTENWNGGDKGSVVWNGTLDSKLQKKLGENWNWLNVLNLAFGQNHQQERDDVGDLYWKKADKTDDLVRFESLLRYTKSSLNPYASFRFESQFLDQNDPRGDFTLNPLEFYETVGISRMFVDTEQRKFLVRLGYTFHQMSREMFLDPAFGDDPVTESASDMGVELVLNYTDKALVGNVEYQTQLRVYQPVSYSAKGELEDLGSDYLVGVGLPGDLADYTTALDVDWEHNFKANITRVINVQLFLRWIYDKYDNSVTPVVVEDEVHNVATVGGAIRKAGQFKQTLSLGLGYTF
jgi:hypothetical protein